MRHFFEANLAKILRFRAAMAGVAPIPAGLVEATVALCLGALRPRDKWPENTRFYLALRDRLAEHPLGALFAAGAVAAVALYVGFGPAALEWAGHMLGG